MKWIEEWLEEANSVVEIPEFDLTGWANLEDWLLANQVIICDFIASSISAAIDEGWSRVPVLAVKDTDVILYIESAQFRDKLNTCLEYYTRAEEFESCVEIVELLKKI